MLLVDMVCLTHEIYDTLFIQLVEGDDVDALYRIPKQLERADLLRIHTGVGRELACRADNDESSGLVVEHDFTGGRTVVMGRSNEAVKMLHCSRDCSLHLRDRTCQVAGWRPATRPVRRRLQQRCVVRLDLDEAERVDDATGLHEAIRPLPTCKKVVPLHDLLQLATFKAGDEEVAQSVSEDPAISLEEHLPKSLIADCALLMTYLVEVFLAG